MTTETQNAVPTFYTIIGKKEYEKDGKKHVVWDEIGTANRARNGAMLIVRPRAGSAIVANTTIMVKPVYKKAEREAKNFEPYEEPQSLVLKVGTEFPVEDGKTATKWEQHGVLVPASECGFYLNLRAGAALICEAVAMVENKGEKSDDAEF